MKLENIQKQLIDKFFGETFQRHVTNVNAIIACTSLDKFLETKKSISEEEFAEIFRACTAKDILSAKYNQRECKGVFLRLKTVSLNTDFI